LQGSSDIVTLRIQKNDTFPGENCLTSIIDIEGGAGRVGEKEALVP
jgi:hypothetical protein